MSKVPYISSKYQESAFNCPICGAFADQSWVREIQGTYIRNKLFRYTDRCTCNHCKCYSIWYEGKMIYPDVSGVEHPNEDLDEGIKNDYLEAASILNKSPRGSAALLRLALQKLCMQLGEKGKDINTDIKSLVASKNLSLTIQQALDALRVIGNESVHPGQIDLRDDPETANALFKLLNKIADTLITEPRQIQEIYDKIPEEKKKAIEKRDKNAPKT